MFGKTPGEQYLAYIGLDDHPDIDTLATELDDEIAFVSEQIVREWKDRDPLLRAVLDDECQMWDYATYPAGRLPAGTPIRIRRDTYRGGDWRGVLRQTNTGAWGNDCVVSWELADDQRYQQAPSVGDDTEVEAWVPIPFDLSPLAGPPKRTPAPAPGRQNVTWDDLAVGQIIRFLHHNRSQRLSGRSARAYLARIRSIQRPEPGRAPRVEVEVLKADLTRNQTLGFQTIYCAPQYHGLDSIVEIVSQPPAAVTPQDLTNLTSEGS